MANFNVQAFMDSLSAEMQEKVKARLKRSLRS